MINNYNALHEIIKQGELNGIFYWLPKTFLTMTLFYKLLNILLVLPLH
jgi:hypothetical protein